MDCSHSRKFNRSELKKLQKGFVCSWETRPKNLQYNALDDKHNKGYFRLPLIRDHLKKLQKKIKKEPNWT